MCGRYVHRRSHVTAPPPARSRATPHALAHQPAPQLIVLGGIDGRPRECDRAVEDRPVGRLDAKRRRELGLCCIPEERHGHGAVPDMSLTENAILSAWRRMKLVASGLIRTMRARDFATTVVERFRVVTPGVDHAASSLSGGNLQKFIVGREILLAAAVLIAAQPTWGVDAGAAMAIHQALLDLAGKGAAVLVISQDLDELLALTDRLAVMNVGRLSAPLLTREADVEEIGLLMGGLHGVEPERAEALHGSAAHVA
jgi:general nucleoside transport system ATP-binding protein